MLGAVASNWEIVAIAFGVPGLVLGLLMVAGSSGRHAPLWALGSVGFGIVAAFGFYYAFFRPVPKAAAAPSTPHATVSPLNPLPSAPASAASCTPTGTTLRVTARSLAFDTKCLAAPANEAVTIEFNNRDSGIPHNIHIFRGTNAGGQTVFAGTIVTGPTSTSYRVPALPPGRYYFQCDVHPTTMNGAFVVP